MKLLKMRRKSLLVLLIVLLTALVAGPVLAGGWAEITMDDLPAEIHAGESVRLSFMVLQHGQTPVHHVFDDQQAVVPLITGSNGKTGESVEFTAVPDKSEVGRFYADIVFPTDGEWSWSIAPDPLIGETEFAPLTILPELPAPVLEATTAESTAATAGSTSLSQGVVWGAGALLLVVGIGLTGLMINRRKRQSSVLVDVGD